MKLTGSQAHRLTGSQAHRLTGSQAHRQPSWRCWDNLAVALTVLMICGCGDHSVSRDGGERNYLAIESATKPVLLASSSSIRPGQNRIDFDAGVVFADKASYVCYPLTRFGIQQASNILAVNSSCSCVRPSLITYYDPQRQVIDALRLDFVPESSGAVSSDFTSYQPSLLSVELGLELADGQARKITVNFLQTLPPTQESMPTEERDE